MAATKNSILIISSEFPPDPGGIGNHAYNLAFHLAAEGYRVTVAADINNTPAQELASFKAKLPFAFRPIVRKKVNTFTYASRVAIAIGAAAKCQYVICSGKFSLWLVSALKAIYPLKKYIAVVHGTELDLKNPKAKQLTDISLAKFNSIVAVSSYTQSFLPARVKANLHHTIIPNGISNREFAPYKTNETLKAYSADATLPIITIGNVTERKGQENVIRALPEMIKLFPKIHYHIAGKPTNKEQLAKLADELQVSAHITFHGMLPRNELLQLLSRCAVKFMLSNHTKEGDFEGFGIAILEANALGIPAIGANFGGITDAIKDGVTGRLTDVHNINEIAACLAEIISNYNSYSSNALQWAQAHDWSMLVKQYIAVLQQLG